MISPDSSESGFEFDRFVIICVMICVASGVFAVGLRFPAVPGWVVRVACKGVWWMPWQTVPMKDV